MSRELLKSECGRYLARRADASGTSYDLLDASGNFVCRTTWWSNLGTNTRIRFECGSGDVGATFSCPRYPRWFYRRWVTCFRIELEELARRIELAGGKVLVGYKPDMNCWHHVGFRGTPAVAKAVDEGLTSMGIEWFKRERPGVWPINCPHEERFGKGAKADA